MLVQKIIKHGNSLAVVIPAQICQQLKIARGDFVVLMLPNQYVIMLNFAAHIASPDIVQELYNAQHKIIDYE